MAEGYFIYKYDISGDQLAVAGMDHEQKEAAIKAGKIKGAIESNNPRFTETTENLTRYFATADSDKLFFTKEAKDEGYATLERVK